MKRLHIALLIILAISMAGNIYLFQKQSANILLSNAVLINCKLTDFRIDELTCSGLSGINDWFKFKFKLPHGSADESEKMGVELFDM